MYSKMLHYTDGDLKNIWLVNGFEVRDTPYGQGVAIHDIDGLTKTICLTLTSKSSTLISEEFRYLRSAGILISQVDLALMMGVDVQSIAHWERGKWLPQWADKLIRVLFIAHVDADKTTK
jgi:DNA-binding transcriptional regulator YiaG